MSRADGSFVIVDGSGQEVRVFKNGNDCAPFLAEGVWEKGASGAPTGYRCFSGVRGLTW